MSISLHWEPHGVLRTCRGPIGFEEYMQSIAELHNHLRFDSLRYIIEDFTLAEVVRITPDEVDMVIASTIGAAYSNPHIRMAAVAQSEPLRQLLGQFFHLSPYVNRLFDDLQAAREWIHSGETAPIPLDIQLQTTVEFSDRPFIY